MLDLRPLRSVSVSDGRAVVGAGARLGEVYEALHEHGLTLPLGCGPTVGIAGLTLGGGLGLLGRRYGLTCDRLLGAQVVLAGGRVVDCDADREPDLFWALRGAGGGQFGVVTSLVFDPVPEPMVTRLELTWAAGDAAAVIAAWQRWAPDTADELTANLAVAAGVVRLFGAMVGLEAETAALLGELPGPPPASRTLTGMGYRALKDALAGPVPDEPIFSRSEFFCQPLPDHAISELLEHRTQDAAPGEHRELNFTALGGAYNRVPPEATAYVHRGERFLLEHVGTPGPEWSRRSWAIAHPFGSGRVYPNFPDPELSSWEQAYHGDNHARLVRVKAAYDPERLLRFPQSI